MDGLTLQNKNSGQFEHALQRFAATSKRSAVEVMKQQAKLLFVEVAKITPPGGGKKGETLTGKTAEKAGQLAIARDLHEIYGMPGRAFSDLRDTAGQDTADTFWSCVKEQRLGSAAKLVNKHLGKSFVKFDGGKAARGLLGKKRKKEPLFYISNPDALHAHVKLLQEHVWYLASGWSEALSALGVSPLPYGVGRHHGPGLLKVEVSDQRIIITAVNDVRYAKQIKQFEAQIQFAMGKRIGVLERRWKDWISGLSKEALNALPMR